MKRRRPGDSQFDKDDVEKVGLVKFDFLGLRTLTIIDWALAIINRRARRRGPRAARHHRHPARRCQCRRKLLQRGETTAVFQLESRGMKDLIKRLKPSKLLRGHRGTGGTVPSGPAAVGHGG
jgi:DNA polymerase-3 subunit alpha